MSPSITAKIIHLLTRVCSPSAQVMVILIGKHTLLKRWRAGRSFPKREILGAISGILLLILMTKQCLLLTEVASTVVVEVVVVW